MSKCSLSLSLFCFFTSVLDSIVDKYVLHFIVQILNFFLLFLKDDPLTFHIILVWWWRIPLPFSCLGSSLSVQFYDFAVGDPTLVLNINYSLLIIKTQEYLLFHLQVVDKVVRYPYLSYLFRLELKTWVKHSLDFSTFVNHWVIRVVCSHDSRSHSLFSYVQR